MSDTPRTDEQERSASSMATFPGRVVKADFARTLERELAEARREFACVKTGCEWKARATAAERSLSEVTPSWRPVSEPPQNGVGVLAFVVNKQHGTTSRTVATYYGPHGWDDESGGPVERFAYRVTHWMPLPDAPK